MRFRGRFPAAVAMSASDLKREERSRYVRLGTSTGATLGEGAYGVVYPAWDKVEGKLVAVKRAKRPAADEHVRELLFFDIVRSAQTPTQNIVRMLDLFDDGRGFPNLVFEYMRSNVDEEFRRARGFLDYDICHKYATELFSGLAQLHALEVCHGDVKLSNCLLDPRENVLKICDLGLAASALDLVFDRTLCTLPYRPPELLLRNGGEQDDGSPEFVPKAVDVWSGGCCVASLYGARLIFDAYARHEKDAWEQQTFLQHVALLDDPRSSWPQAPSYQSWSRWEPALLETLRSRPAASPQEMLESGKELGLRRGLSHGVARAVCKALWWNPGGRCEAKEMQLALKSASARGEDVAPLSPPSGGGSSSSGASRAALASTSSSGAVSGSEMLTGRKRQRQWAAPPNRCGCPLNCGQRTCMRAKKARHTSGTAHFCGSAPAVGFVICFACKCSRHDCNLSKVQGPFCKAHAVDAKSAKINPFGGIVRVRREWPWEVAMTAKHALWLPSILPCDLDAFLEAAEHLCGQATELVGSQLLHLVTLAVVKWPVACAKIAKTATQEPFGARALRESFRAGLDAAYATDLQWMHAQISDGHVRHLQGLAKVLKEFGCLVATESNENDALSFTDGGVKYLWTDFADDESLPQVLTDSVEYANSAKPIRIPNTSGREETKAFADEVAAFIDGLPVRLASKSKTSYSVKHIVRKVLLWIARTRLPRLTDHWTIDDLKTHTPDENDFLSKVCGAQSLCSAFEVKVGVPALLFSCWACLFSKIKPGKDKAGFDLRACFGTRDPSDCALEAVKLKEAISFIAPQPLTLAKAMRQ